VFLEFGGKSRLTVGFSGSGGAGKTPSPTKTFAGSRRIPASGEAAVRCKRCWALTPAGARYPCPQAPFSLLAKYKRYRHIPQFIIAHLQARHHRQNTRRPSRPTAGKATARPLTFASNRARPQASKMLGSKHPAPTGYPFQPDPLPFPHHARQNYAQASTPPGSRSGRGRPGKPVRAKDFPHRPESHPCRQHSMPGGPPQQPKRYLFQSSFYTRPTARTSAAA